MSGADVACSGRSHSMMIGGDMDQPRPTERIGKIKISKEAFNVRCCFFFLGGGVEGGLHGVVGLRIV